MIIVFFIIGITNSVNFTDGLDGLVAGSSAISFGGILIISFWIYRHPTYYSNFIGDDFLTVELSLLISAVAGACLGFLWWNTNPAKIIMGDEGSHFLGSLFPLILFASQNKSNSNISKLDLIVTVSIKGVFRIDSGKTSFSEIHGI